MAQPFRRIAFKACGLHAFFGMLRKRFPEPKATSRELRREIVRLKQRSEEILLRLDELVRQLEVVQKKTSQRTPTKK